MNLQMVVMNGSKLLQEMHDGKVCIFSVSPAGNLRNGIYNLYRADRADTRRAYTGSILHADVHCVYQLVGQEIVSHERRNFTGVPASGSTCTIRYAAGWANVSAA